MFTGLVEEVGTVISVLENAGGRFIEISCEKILDDLSLGDSVSVSGACQTVTEIKKKAFVIFASKITLSLTTLAFFKKNQSVNLERAMSLNGRFGGHIVQGHVDGIASVKRLKKDSNGLEIFLETKAEILKYLVEKGSVTVDGVSLTVVSITDGGFNIYLIPETLSNTILPFLKVNDKVNVEVDILSKYVENFLNTKNDSSNEKDLKKMLFEEGFI